MTQERPDHENPRTFPVWHYCATFSEPLDYSTDKGDGQRPRCIGVFSTEQAASAAIGECRSQPGFREWPDSFKILETRLDFEEIVPP